jgi:hypothetical protein
MDLFAPLRFGVGLSQTLASSAFRLAATGPRLVTTLLRRGPAAAAEEVRDTVEDAAVNGSPGAREAREAAVRDATVLAARPPAEDTAAAATRAGDTPAARPEPTSAAGASGGIGGTLDAPGEAALAGAPDPTGDAPSIPQGERRTIDVAPPAREKTVDDTDPVVHSFGDPGDPGAVLAVQEPWEGYARAKVGEVLERLQGADAATRAVVLLYEQTHKKRKRVITAATA